MRFKSELYNMYINATGQCKVQGSSTNLLVCVVWPHAMDPLSVHNRRSAVSVGGTVGWSRLVETIDE